MKHLYKIRTECLKMTSNKFVDRLFHEENCILSPGQLRSYERGNYKLDKLTKGHIAHMLNMPLWGFDEEEK